MKVVFLCQADHAGGAWQAARAVNKVGRIQARHITCFKHPLGFAADIVLPSVGGMASVNDCRRYQEACDVLNDADIVHCWNDEYHDFFGWDKSPTKSFIGEFPEFRNKYKSVTFTGSWYRKNFLTINRRLAETGIELVVNTPAFLTGDDTISPTFIPHAIDTTTIRPLPATERISNLIGVYKQQSTTSKEDIEILRGILKKSFPDWYIGLESKVSHEENIMQLARCQFFMQHTDNRMISYGRSSVEAMALGVPVFNSVCRQAAHIWPDIPIFDISQSNMESALHYAINICDHATISEMSREFAVKVHDYSVVGERYTKFFESLV